MAAQIVPFSSISRSRGLNPRLQTPGRRFGLGAAMVLTLGLLLAGSAAHAISNVAGGTAGSPFVTVLCDGDCSNLPATDGRGTDFDFEYGARAILDGVDLSIISQGSVFIHGPVNATDITLVAQGAIAIDGGLVGEIEIDPVRIDAAELELIWTPLIELPPRLSEDDYFNPLCACLELVPGRPLPELLDGPGGPVIRPAALTGSAPATPQNLGYTISRTGDVYLDLSGVDLGRLYVKAFDTIVVDQFGTNPVPEPGTALLLGAGLAILAVRRTR